MAATGQTLNDRLNAVRYALAGQGLARTVCKATTEEVLGPKKKHIDYLLACTKEPNISIPQLANLLIERSQHTNWAVVFKSLISIHQLMSNGDIRFSQYLATSNHTFKLDDFMDRTTPQGYNMSNFVRKYAKYINDKILSYRTLAIDLCRIKSGNDNALRTMNMDNLGKTLPIVQAQFDSLLDFGADHKNLNNGVIMAAFRMLYKDLVRLYVAYQEAIINLLERYFKLSRRKTRDALEMYKRYLSRMDKVADFLRVVEAVGLDKSEMPDLTKSPASILEILEKHLATLEAKKRGATPDAPDEEQEANKENVTEPSMASSEALPQPAEVSSSGPPSNPKKPTVDTSDETPSTSAAAPLKKIPPARPSPVASPRVSPKSSPARTSPSTSGTAAPPKKSAPPERPAKPPSRPPPPSSAAPPPSNHSAAPRGSGPKASGSEPSKAQLTKSPPASTPPHPPPPTRSPIPGSADKPAGPRSEVQKTDDQATIPVAASQEAQPQHLDTSSQDVDQSAQRPADDSPVSSSAVAEESHYDDENDANSHGQFSCGSVANPGSQVEEVDVESDDAPAVVGSNHVENNVVENNHQSAHVDELDMPPPPPPIDADEFDAENFGADGGQHDDEQQEHLNEGQAEAAPRVDIEGQQNTVDEPNTNGRENTSNNHL